MSIKWVPLLGLATVALSCSSPDDSAFPLHAPDLSTPVVTGIRITSVNGPEQIAVWGTPSDPESWFPGTIYFPDDSLVDTVEPGEIPRDFGFTNPFPNPSNGSMMLVFALPMASTVNLWVVRARWVGSENSDWASIAGGTMPAPANGAIRTLLRNDSLFAGTYSYTWDGLDDRGTPVPGGFYRVYFRVREYTSWHDILIARSPYDLPPGLPPGIYPR